MESKALLAVALWLCVETWAASEGKEPILQVRRRGGVRAESWE